MEFFQEFFVTALLALVFACVIAKLVVSVALHGDDKAADKVKVVESQSNLVKKGLRIKGSKSKKRVQFSDDVAIKHVDYMFEVEDERREFEDEIKSAVNYYYDYDVCESSGVSIDESIEESSGKGEILKRVDQVDDHGVIVEEKCENSKRVDRVDDERVVDEGKIEKGGILTRVDQFDDQSDEIVGGVCGDDGEKVSSDVTLWFESMFGEIVEGKSEIDESCGVEKENVVIGGLDSFVAEEKMKREEVGGTSGSKDLVEDEIVSAKSGVELESEIFSSRLNEASENRGGLCKGDESSNVKEEENVVISESDTLVAEEVGGTSGLEDLVVKGKKESEEVNAISDVAIDLKEEGRVVERGENRGGLRKGDEEEAEVKSEGVVIYDDDDDDWEGIERTELEKQFGEAVNHIECGVKTKDDQLANLGSDVQMQLYGLHKIAVEGTCHEPQPMALNFTARAKWNAWQKLGSMSREVAMEEYIKLLSEHSRSSSQDIQPNVISERELEVNYVTKGDDQNASGNSE